ncbi:hypothetical protein ACCO45_000134 [Purpureocillium lilacinum]|uniref:Uncharacterized protein n=1 Tax=Purpureocillium lilacinum TaxID=33203 RepID=A0ACC4E3C4_PURLI
MKTSLVYLAALVLSAIAVPVEHSEAGLNPELPAVDSKAAKAPPANANAAPKAAPKPAPKKAPTPKQDPKKSPKQDPKKSPKQDPKAAPKPAPKKGAPAPKKGQPAPKKGKPAPKAAPKPNAAAPNATAPLPLGPETCAGMGKSCAHVYNKFKDALDNGTIDLEMIDEFAAKLERDPKCADAVQDCGGKLPQGVLPAPASAGAPKGGAAPTKGKGPATGKPAGPAGGASAPKTK